MQQFTNVFDNTRKDSLLVYGEQLFAGYHDSNLKKYPEKRKWYEEVNHLKYKCQNEVQVAKVSNALRRVNCHFPINHAKSEKNKQVYHTMRRIFESHDVSMLSNVMKKDNLLIGFHSVDLKSGELEIFTLRTFMLPAHMSEKAVIKSILQMKETISANMYPYNVEQSSSENVKELTLHNIPGCLLGLDVSNSILNKDSLFCLGISKNNYEDEVFISERQWDNNMYGRPNFQSISGWVKADRLKLPQNYKLISFAVLEDRESNRQWMFLDNNTHKVIFL